MADAALDHAPRGVVGDGRAVQPDAAAARLAQPRHDLRQLALAVARDPCDAQDFAGTNLQRQIAQGGQSLVVQRVEALHLQHHIARRAALLLCGEQDLAADHHARELRIVGFTRRKRPDDAAPAQDGDAVRRVEDFAQLMGDEDDGLALGGQVADRFVELFGLLGG